MAIKHIHYILIILFIFFVFAVSNALGYEITTNKPDLVEAKLKNGLRILIVPDHKAPVATFQVWYKVGSTDESMGLTGQAHLMEHMMFKGTAKHGPKTFSQTIQKYGGNDNAFTGNDYTAYFQNLNSNNIDISIELESDRMNSLIITPEKLASEKEVVKEERRMRTEDNPINELFEQLNATSFVSHPYHHPVVGWMSDLDNITAGTLNEFYHKYYAPNNATIVIVGDVEPKEVLPKIEKAFGSIPAKKIDRIIVTEPPQNGNRQVTLVRDAQLPMYAQAYHVPNYKQSNDAYALEVLAGILSGGKTSRLYKTLVYDTQLALDAGGEMDLVSRDPNLFYIYAQNRVNDQKTTDAIIQAINTEILKLKTTKVSDTELQKVKNQIEASFIFGQDSNFNRAMILGQYATVGSWSDRDKYLPAIRAVTADDIMRVANKYLIETNMTEGYLVPKK